MKKYREHKICKYCETMFFCPTRNTVDQYSISTNNWKRRMFCSKNCSSKVNSNRDDVIKKRLSKSFTIEHRLNLSKARKGKKRNPFTEEHKLKLSIAHLGIPSKNKGKKFPERSGENHHFWIKDRTKLQKYGSLNKDRRSSAYRYWRKSVWLRDNFKCKIANPDCLGRLEAHHILSYTNYPELRYDINNGITLCHAHHPRKKAEEKRLIPTFQELVSVSSKKF